MKHMLKAFASILLTVTLIPFFSACTVSAEQSNTAIIFEFLTDELGLNNAAACGIMGNIYQECTMNPDAGGTFYGICQWGGSRKSALYSFCEENGYAASSLDGQLLYLERELNNSYYDTYDHLLNVENTASGARDAAAYFCTHFEQPGNLSWENEHRGSLAVDLFWPDYGA